MFKLPLPQADVKSNIEEFTDFIEWQCIRSGPVSLLSIIKPLMISQDEIKLRGIDDESDELIAKLDDVGKEMERRKIACGGTYPFNISPNGYFINFTRESKNADVYLFLLLATRLHMDKNKVQGGVDGTKIFEKISGPVATSYFGERTTSIVFGTSTPGGFRAKVQELVKFIGEGAEFRDRDYGRSKPQDDKLDVVVLKDFSDKKSSKLIGFGQCKTGTTWDSKDLLELQPQVFCESWLMDQPIVTPIKMFFCAQYFPLDFHSKKKQAGLVFDRFRIMDCAPPLLPDLLAEVKQWNDAAFQTANSSFQVLTIYKGSRKKVRPRK